ncbi:MAG: L-aspartate oxidase [Verrucomicrobiales bacterium]|nr:L-aspartate oxidase [Verrucomicrobiales bacterium]
MDIEADYLIIGSGIAGLFFALKAARRGSVAVVTKRERRESNTQYAQGGIAAAMDVADSFESHVRDTLSAGDGLCDRAVVEAVVAEGPEVVRELVAIDTRFNEEAPGILALGREGGHEYPRVVHADDMTGREVARALIRAVEALPQVALYDHHLAIDLIADDQNRCRGAWVLDAHNGQRIKALAPVTLLATGGCGQVFLHTTNPQVASGDGVAMAWRAGARVGNMEFTQFHPTMLYDPGGPSFLISEALRGFGAELVNDRGAAFTDSLKTRDVVSRAIVAEMQERGADCVYLDATGKDAEQTRRRFPNIYQHCLGIGIDMTKEPIPVVPAAHYMCGGVCTDAHGQTDIVGLYAAGEVAMSGFQGANRLASNSLLEGLVFARRAAEHARLDASGAVPRVDLEEGDARIGTGELEQRRQALRRLMWDEVGIVRSDRSLERACVETGRIAGEIRALYKGQALDAELIQLRNLATVAELIARSARQRQESRGVHYNSDYPERDDIDWQRPSLLVEHQAGH